MARAARHYQQAVTIEAADNTEGTITVQSGVLALGVLVGWGADSPDGTLGLWAEWDNAAGAAPIRVSLTTAIAAGTNARVTVPDGCPARIVYQRIGSTAGSVTVALLPTEVV